MPSAPVSYALAQSYVIVDAGLEKTSLNAQVWSHERIAREQGLSLVIEIHSISVLASRRLTEWWRAGGSLAEETLRGIYLLRVDLKRFGPEAILRLTPYAVAGAPLFVGWNPMGQVLGRSQFHELTPASMALPLSAFVEDVLAARPHTLNPHPAIGNAERNREAQALREAQRKLPAMQREVPHASAEPPTLDQAEVPHASAEPPTLDQLLNSARGRFGELEDLLDHTLCFSLEDLRTLDLVFDELDDQQRLDFARELGAVLAVYLGDTIRTHIPADWQFEPDEKQAAKRLMLRGEVLAERKQMQPMEWVVETLADRSRSLYGQALAWCRIH